MNWWIIAYLGLITLSLGVILARHGQPRTGNYHFGSALASAAITIFLLYMGGAFS